MDPNLIICNGLALIGNKLSNSLYKYVVDFDFTSLYPTILELFNIYKSTLIGKIYIPGEPNEKEKFLADADFEDDITYDRGAKFMEDLETKEPLFIGERHLGLPTIEETLSIFDNELDNEVKKHVVTICKKKQSYKKKHIVQIIRKEKVS